MIERLPVVAALGLAVASYWFFLRGQIETRPRIAAWLYAGTRSRFFAFWCLRAGVLFGLVSVLLLLMLGWGGALHGFPVPFLPVHALVVPYVGDWGAFPVSYVVIGLLIGGVIGGVVDRLRRGRRPFMLGDVSRVLPRHRGELGWAAAMAVTAGVTEELFFRLLIPLLVTLLIGNALVGFGVGTILFAGAHRYQGWTGVGATAFVGVLMAGLYCATGLLWVAMLIHALIDLNGLVLRPVMAGVWRISSSAASRF